MLRKFLISVSLIIAILAIGVGAATLLVFTKSAPQKRDSERPPMLVRCQRLTPHTARETLVGYGTARADRLAQVSAEVSGLVEYVSDNLKPGSSVAQGEVLIRLDDREYKARLDRARHQVAAEEAALANIAIEVTNVTELERIALVELEIANREQVRVQKLFEQGLAGRRELDTAEGDVEARRRVLQNLRKEHEYLPNTRRQREAAVQLRRADVEIAALNLARCVIAAPFAGRIEQVRVELGERIAAGTWQFSLLDPALIEIPVEIPMSWYPRLAVGAVCRIATEADGGVVWSGKVARIAPSGNSDMRTISAYVEVDNRTQPIPLKPGLFVRAEIDGSVFENALTVPRGAVQDGAVFVYEGGVAHRREVRVTRQILAESLVSGLEPGVIVITSNLDALADGAPVRIDLTNDDYGPAIQADAQDSEQPRTP